MSTNESVQPLVVEWNERENIFYFRKLGESLERNQATYLEGSRCHNYPLAIVESDFAAVEFAKIFAAERNNLRTVGDLDPPTTVSNALDIAGTAVQNTLEWYGEEYCF